MYQKQNSYFKYFIILGLILFAVMFHTQHKGIRRGIAGIKAPIQKECLGQTTKEIGGYQMQILYKYSYDITALVVHTKTYGGALSFSVGDKLAPKDLALAWGKVAEYNDRIDFHWNQLSRWVTFEVDDIRELDPVGGLDGVSKSSSNNHIIPADKNVKKEIRKIKTGDHIRLKGYLVNVVGYKGEDTTFTWHSSTSRDDTGDGACELIYVTEVQWLD
ncbi:MAG: hypothetical protein E7294_01785 [Lachnospiraceae bacterium]|jgi:hypothetical protein|nr:hypothetical protein [Lachnospiraceae bacterium]